MRCPFPWHHQILYNTCRQGFISAHRLSPKTLDANSTTVGAALPRVAIVPGIIDTLLAALARDAGDTAAEDGLDANSGPVAGQTTAGDVWVVNADLVVSALERLDAEAAAGLVSRRRGARFRRSHKSDGDGHAVASAVLAAVALRVDLLAVLVAGARGNLEATGPWCHLGCGKAEEGEEGNRKVPHVGDFMTDFTRQGSSLDVMGLLINWYGSRTERCFETGELGALCMSLDIRGFPTVWPHWPWQV